MVDRSAITPRGTGHKKGSHHTEKQDQSPDWKHISYLLQTNCRQEEWRNHNSAREGEISEGGRKDKAKEAKERKLEEEAAKRMAMRSIEGKREGGD